MRNTKRATRLARVSVLAATTLLLAACGGGFDSRAEETGDSGQSGGGSAGPEISDPPPIEGEVVSEGDDHTIKFGIGLSPGSPQYISVEYFRDILDERTDGRLEVNIFPDSQVGDDAQMMSALQSGTLEMTYPSTSPAASIVPEVAIFDLPFLFPTPESADEVLDGEVGQEILGKFDGTGIKALAFAENGYRQLTNSKTAVSSPDDVKGLAVRVMENPVQVDIWKALGANPTSMAFGEVFSALEQGVVDGQENPWNTILTSKFYEVQDYASETRHVYTPFVIMIGQKFYDGLSPEDQQIVQEAAVAAGKYERTVSREFNDYAKEQVTSEGMEVTELSDEDIAAFKEAVQPVYDKWAPKIGKDLVERVQQQAGQ